MGEFINILQARTSMAKSGGYLPLYYPIYMQDAHLGLIAGKPEPPKLNTFKGENTPRSLLIDMLNPPEKINPT